AARPQGVRRRGAGRDRQHPGRDGGRAPARHRRDAGLRLPLEHVPRRDRLRDPDRDPALPADRPVRHGAGGEGVVRRAAFLAIAAVALLALAELALPQVLNRYYATIGVRILVAVLAATSLQLVNGFTGQFS